MKTLEDAVERILDYLSWGETHQDLPWAADPDWDARQSEFCKLPLTYFNEMEVFPVAKELQMLTKTYDRLFLAPNEIRPGDLPKAWQTKFLSFPLGSFRETFHEQPVYCCTSYRNVPLPEVRGKFKILGSVVEASHGLLFPRGAFTTQRIYIQHVGKGKWVAAGQPIAVEPDPLTQDENDHVQLAMSMAFSADYDWRVVLGFGNSLPTVSLVTDPIGSREIFRLRDLPPGGSRRAALRHWVRTHYRQVHRDPPEEKKIQAHLRGAEEFVWNGMYCKICPSPYDLRKATELRKEKVS